MDRFCGSLQPVSIGKRQDDVNLCVFFSVGGLQCHRDVWSNVSWPSVPTSQGNSKG